MSHWFEKNADLGLLFLRLFIGIRLIYGVQDNILSWKHMKEFEAFLTQFHFPFPLVCAVVSVYVQALSGLMLMIGWYIRLAALLLIINFSVALFMVHWGQSFEEMTVVLFLIFTSVLFLFAGAGWYSLDKRSLFILYPQTNHDKI
jgi:putative oxidoreductase